MSHKKPMVNEIEKVIALFGDIGHDNSRACRRLRALVRRAYDLGNAGRPKWSDAQFREVFGFKP